MKEPLGTTNPASVAIEEPLVVNPNPNPAYVSNEELVVLNPNPDVLFQMKRLVSSMNRM